MGKRRGKRVNEEGQSEFYMGREMQGGELRREKEDEGRGRKGERKDEFHVQGCVGGQSLRL